MTSPHPHPARARGVVAAMLLCLVAPGPRPAHAAAGASIETAPLVRGFHSVLQGVSHLPVLLPATIDTTGAKRSTFAPIAKIEQLGDGSYDVAFLQRLSANDRPSDLSPYDKHLLADVTATRSPAGGWLAGRKIALPGGRTAFFTPSDPNGNTLIVVVAGKISYGITLQKGVTPKAALATATSMTLRPAAFEVISVSGIAALRPSLRALHSAANVPVIVPARIDVRAFFGVPLAVTVAKSERPATYRVDLTDAAGIANRIASLEGSPSPIAGRAVDASQNVVTAPNVANATLADGTKAVFDPGGECGRACSIDTVLRFQRGAAYYAIAMPFGPNDDPGVAEARLVRFATHLVVVDAAP